MRIMDEVFGEQNRKRLSAGEEDIINQILKVKRLAK